MNSHTFKRVSPIVSFLLTNITLGAYVPYWFLSRRNAIEHLGETRIKFNVIKLLFGLYIILALYYLVGAALFSEMGKAFVETINLWVTFTGLGITYFSAFRLSEEIETYFPEVKFNRFLILIFHIWYLQFKLNQLPKEDGANENKKSIKGRKRLSFN